MNDTNIPPRAKRIRVQVAGTLLLLLPGSPVLSESGALLIQPGAPGEPSRTITAGESAALARTERHPADAQFMRDMIIHHSQALEMVELLKVRTQREEMRLIAQRIAISQSDEIKMMRMWLLQRGESPPDSHVHHTSDAHARMPMRSMLTPEQMKALGAAHGSTFDRLFLQGMIQHHQGALDMVRELMSTPGAGEDPSLFDFTASIVTDQTAEISRMQDMLTRISP
jgi:uncharacterized protein (DUF305 family)